MNGKIYKYFNRKKYEEEGIEKYYIGQTIQTIEQRAGKDGKNYITGYENNKFANAIKKWGWDAFECEILEENIQTYEELNEAEIKYINEYDSFNNGYNSTTGGDSSAGYRYSEEYKKHLSENNARKQKVYSPELCMSFNSITEASAFIGLKSTHSISKMCRGGDIKYAGQAIIDGKETKLTWKYIDSDEDVLLCNKDIKIINPVTKRKVYCPELDMKFESIKEAAKFINLKSDSSIRDALKNKQPHAGQAIIDGKETKLTWKYIDSDEEDNINVANNTNKVKITKHATKRKVYCPELDMKFESAAEATNYIGLKSRSDILRACKGERSFAGRKEINGIKTKLTWKYID